MPLDDIGAPPIMQRIPLPPPQRRQTEGSTEESPQGEVIPREREMRRPFQRRTDRVIGMEIRTQEEKSRSHRRKEILEEKMELFLLI